MELVLFLKLGTKIKLVPFKQDKREQTPGNFQKLIISEYEYIVVILVNSTNYM